MVEPRTQLRVDSIPGGCAESSAPGVPGEKKTTVADRATFLSNLFSDDPVTLVLASPHPVGCPARPFVPFGCCKKLRAQPSYRKAHAGERRWENAP